FLRLLLFLSYNINIQYRPYQFLNVLLRYTVYFAIYQKSPSLLKRKTHPSSRYGSSYIHSLTSNRLNWLMASIIAGPDGVIPLLTSFGNITDTSANRSAQS